MATVAKMGFVGYVKFLPTAGSGNTNPVSVRVTSADVKLSQEISYPELVDNKIDQTVYQLGPMVVGGNIAFPLVHEGGALTTALTTHNGVACQTTGDTLASTLWRFAAERDNVGRMNNKFNTIVRYADNLAYQYNGCYVNQMTFTISQSESVNVSIEVIGGADALATGSGGDPNLNLRKKPTLSAGDDLTKFLSPARIVTWNDARLALFSGSSDVVGPPATFVDSSEIREFTCMINNNIERFYTLNGRLAPQDIAAKKREISGTMKLMGHNENLAIYTFNNDKRFTSDAGIAFGYALGGGQTPYWATGFYGVVMEIPEVALSTGLFETSVKWRALGDCTNSFLATKLGTSQSLTYPTSSQYGNDTFSPTTGQPNTYPTFTV